MKRKPAFGFTFPLSIATLLLHALPAQAASTGFNQTGVGPYDYNDTANWASSTINGLWDTSLTLTSAQTVTFAADTVLTNGLNFNYGGNLALTLQASAAGTQTVTLGSDINLNTGGGSSANVTLGNATNHLNVDLGGATRTMTVASNRTLTMLDVISNGGIIKSGTGTLTLSGANTYIGGTTISAGVLNAGSGGALSTGAVVNNATLNLTSTALTTYTFGAVSGNGIINISLGSGSTTATFTNPTWTSFAGTINIGVSQAAGSGKVLIKNALSSTATVNITTNSTLYTGFGGTGVTHSAALTMGGGDTGENGGQLRFGTNNDVWAGAITLMGSVTGATDFTVGADSGVTAAISGAISESGGSRLFSKGGVGTLILSGANTYTGITSVTAGTLQFSNKAALYNGNSANWTNSKITVNSGTTMIVNVGGTGEFNTTDVTSLLTGLGGLGGSVNNNGLLSGSTIGFDTSNASGGIFTMADNIANSTGTGGGAISLSVLGTKTLVLSGANTNTGASSISGGATLVLDYGSGQDNSKLSSTAALNLNGGSLVLRGGSYQQVVLGTTMATTTGNFISREVGSTATINLNAFTLTSTLSTVSFAADNIAKTDRLNTNGILGAWFTVGSHWAINSTNAADGLITAYAGYTDFSSATSISEDVNFQLLGAATLAGAIKANTLRIEGTANDQILSLGANLLSISNLTGTNAVAGTSGGILYAGGANGNYTISGTAATGIQSENPNGQGLLINTYSGTLNITAKLGGGSSPIIKTGEGTLVLGQNNALESGAFRVYQGVLRLTNNGAAGTTAGGIFVQNGAALELVNGIAIGAEALTITGNGVSNAGALRNVASSTSSYAGAITIGSGGARINSDASGSLTLTGGVVTFVNNNVTFGGAGNTAVQTTAISGTGGLIKDGTGTLTLSGTHTYTGTTTASSGSLIVSGNISTSVLTTVQTGATLGGSGTVGALTINSGGFVTPGISSGVLTVNGAYTQAGQCTMDIAGTTVGTGYDQIAVTGSVNVTGGTLVALFASTGYSAGNLLFILTNDGTDAIAGTFMGLAEGAAVTNYDGLDWKITYTADSGTSSYTGGNDIALKAFAPIPEPNIAALLGSFGVFAMLRRRRGAAI